MIPIAGSAYTYSYATMGELVAWIIGWDLVLEYAVGAATVGIAWSEYLNKLLEYLSGIARSRTSGATRRSSRCRRAATGVHGIMNMPGARSSCSMLTLLLIRGMQESAFVNGIIVDHQGHDRHPGHRARLGLHQPGEPHAVHPRRRRRTSTAQGVTHNYGGIMGILGAAGVVFFAFIGFDAVSTAAQESEEPEARHADRHPRLARRSAPCSTSCSRTC